MSYIDLQVANARRCPDESESCALILHTQMHKIELGYQVVKLTSNEVKVCKMRVSKQWSSQLGMDKLADLIDLY